jgi:hypothetical protein
VQPARASGRRKLAPLSLEEEEPKPKEKLPEEKPKSKKKLKSYEAAFKLFLHHENNQPR